MNKEVMPNGTTEYTFNSEDEREEAVKDALKKYLVAIGAELKDVERVSVWWQADTFRITVTKFNETQGLS